MTNWETRQRRKDAVKARASKPDPQAYICAVDRCRNPTRAGARNGLDQRFCRKHAEHYQRHGSPYKGSYTAAQLNPYRRAAIDWLIANAHDRWVANAVDRVRGLYRRGGSFEEATRLRGLPPRTRANVAWARLRKFEIDPRVVVAAWLAVEMIIADDRQPVLTTEFKRVQAAKLVHRQASGTHKHWEVPEPTELHKYPPSRGNVLRYIGADLQEAVALLVEYRMAAIKAHKSDRPAPTKPSTRAKPRSVPGRKQTPVAAAKRAARKRPKARSSFAKPGTYKAGKGIMLVTK